MNEVQAVKFWNAIATGEIIGHVPDTEVCKGGEITKPTYTSSLCEHYDLPVLTVPRMSYYGIEYGVHPNMTNPNKEQCFEVADFLRSLADRIESAATVKTE